jgi:hypothetical protein
VQRNNKKTWSIFGSRGGARNSSFFLTVRVEPGIHFQKLVEFKFFGEANKDGMMGPERRKDCLRGFIYLDKKRHVNYQGGNNTKHQAQDPIGYR